MGDLTELEASHKKSILYGISVVSKHECLKTFEALRVQFMKFTQLIKKSVITCF